MILDELAAKYAFRGRTPMTIPQALEIKEELETIDRLLKELEEEEIITRNVDVTAFPVRTAYTLTESGLEIVEIIRDIKGWALKWKIKNIPCGEQDCKVCVL